MQKILVFRQIYWQPMLGRFWQRGGINPQRLVLNANHDMSDNWLRYVPVDPQFQPSPLAAKAAEALLLSFCPEAEEVNSEFTESVAFIDPGANWSGVQCPSCAAMTSLNAMHYVWPAAFGRYVVEAMNTNLEGLSAIQLGQLATALGCPVTEVAVHV